ncbi:hypothetical protein ACFL21_04290 [Patescibacteria group bacterium]
MNPEENQNTPTDTPIPTNTETTPAQEPPSTPEPVGEAPKQEFDVSQQTSATEKPEKKEEGSKEGGGLLKEEKAPVSLLRGSKGLIIAIIIVIIVAIIGIVAMMGSGSSESYQGMIKKVEQETTKVSTP